MSNDQAAPKRHPWRTLLILAAVVVALAIYGQLGNEDVADPEVPTTPGQTEPFATAAPPVPGPANAMELTERLEQPAPMLRARAVAAKDGRALPAAKLVALGPAGRKFEAVGSASWENMATGEWTVTASAEGFFAAEAGANLRRGKDGDLKLELREAAIVEGVVQSTFGQPLVNARMYFLQEGQDLPRLPTEGQELPQCMPAVGGRFTSPSLPAGRYRIACRALGRETLESAYATLKEGERKQAEVWLDRGGVLLVSLDAGLELPERGGTIRLLKGEEGFGDPEESASSIGRWRPDRTERIKRGETFLFDNLYRGSYKLGLLAGELGRFETTESLDLQGGEALAIRLVPSGDGAPPPEKGPRPLEMKRLEGANGLPPRQEQAIRWLDE